ncbi:MAG: YeeE/YedE family protein [Anaerolineales bacterium]|nr:YeeE/YedE family protein [Chloroflexota bacterium]MBL7162864.1 YeeE/YedE family protein [Anaerolineales bacterium]
MTTAIITGLIVGIIFGFVMQRGRFCMNSAIRDTALLQDYTLLKSVGVAILVSMVGFAIMDATGMISINPKPLFWGANLVGSFIFGVGMVIAGGCASGITYRVGEGMMGALAAVIGLATTGTLTAMGFLKPIKDALQSSTIVKTADDANLTLANVLGVPYWILALIIAILAGVIWYLMARKNGDDDLAVDSSAPFFKRTWNWLVTGIGIGIVGIISFPISAAAGRNYPLGITAGWIQWVKVVILRVEGQAVNWIAAMVLGIVIGAFIAALLAGEFKFRFPKLGMIGQAFLGGLIMGFGAVTSGGCNVTHILSGIPQLSIGSFVAAIAIALGAWVTAYLIFVRPQKA